MSETFIREDGNTELWHSIFAVGHPDLSAQQQFHSRLPRDPRCKLCKAPFAGLGGLYMRFRGKVPSSRNKHYCNACDGFLDAFPGGAEVEMSILFADIRHSTAFAETAGPRAASVRVNRFLDEATEAITDNDGFILAFYGDCIVATWPPGFSGPDHAALAVQAARDIARKARAAPDAAPVGVGVHMGSVYIGTVQAAKGLFRDVSIFGVEVNVAARLAASAAAGEALASREICEAAKITGETAGMREFELKGISRPVEAAALV
jgi:adenylate cyclase